MLSDDLNKKKLAQFLAGQRFETIGVFANFMKSKLPEVFFIEEDRLHGNLSETSESFDFQILDALTKRETLVLLSLKISKTTPSLTTQHLSDFHQKALQLKALYGVLMTEVEVYFFEYKNSQVVEIPSLKPFNHIEYESEREINWEKVRDLILSRKKLSLTIASFLVLITAASLANASVCKRSGVVKGEVTAQGEKFYYTPEHSSYNLKTTGDMPGERRFCSESKAIQAGWIKGR